MKGWIWWLIGVLVILLAGGIYFYTAAHVCFGCEESYCVTTINDQIKSDLDNLFNDSWFGQEGIIFWTPPTKLISLEPNKLCGVAFEIQNRPDPRFNWSDSFNYSIIIPDPRSVQRCGLSEEEVRGWIVSEQNGEFHLSKGERHYGLIVLKATKNHINCVIKFELNINSGNKTYAYNSFAVEVKN